MIAKGSSTRDTAHERAAMRVGSLYVFDSISRNQGRNNRDDTSSSQSRLNGGESVSEATVRTTVGRGRQLESNAAMTTDATKPIATNERLNQADVGVTAARARAPNLTRARAVLGQNTLYARTVEAAVRPPPRDPLSSPESFPTLTSAA